jgi:hypothetical protein
MLVSLSPLMYYYVFMYRRFILLIVSTKERIRLRNEVSFLSIPGRLSSPADHQPGVLKMPVRAFCFGVF